MDLVRQQGRLGGVTRHHYCGERGVVAIVLSVENGNSASQCYVGHQMRATGNQEAGGLISLLCGAWRRIERSAAAKFRVLLVTSSRSTWS